MRWLRAFVCFWMDHDDVTSRDGRALVCVRCGKVSVRV